MCLFPSNHITQIWTMRSLVVCLFQHSISKTMEARLTLLLCAVLLSRANCQTSTSQGFDSHNATPQGTDASTTNVPAASHNSESGIPSGSALLHDLTSQTNSPLPTTFTAFTSNSTMTTNGETGGASDWLGSILAFANLLANAPTLQSAAENNSQVLKNLMGQFPGLVQGLAGANLQGNDEAQVLASLFSDPR